jgi:uncharacterized protein
MTLEGVVTNVAAFGAFVDIGVHQDGLVHVSAMASRFIKDPHEVVKAGDVVQVKVLEVDVKRQRIGLSMRLTDEVLSDTGTRSAAPAARRRDGTSGHGANGGHGGGQAGGKRAPEPASAMAQAFAKLKQR